MKTPHTHPLFTRIFPFLIMGVMLILFILGLFIFTYLFIFAMIIGSVLFIINYVRTKFFRPKTNPVGSAQNLQPKKVGRIIEHEDDPH